MTTRSIALLLLTSCFRFEHEPACEEGATEVADAEATPAGTAVELLAVVSGEGTSAGVLADDSVVGVAWSVVRGDGSARWVESVESTHTTRTLGIGSFTSQVVGPACFDRLEVPVIASLTTDGGDVDVSMSTIAEANRLEQGGIRTNL